MQDKIEILKEKLKEAEDEKKLQELLKELSNIQAEYEGKSFGSHTFNRKSAANYMEAVHYEKFYIKENKIYVLEKSILMSKFNNFYKPSKTDVNYTRNYHERCLTNGETNVFYNLYSGYSFFKKEISNEVFEQLWAGAEECSIIIKNLFNSKLPELLTENISQGDHKDEESIENSIKIMNLDIIDFTLFPKVHAYIKYATLPMYQDRRWMPRIYAKTILEHHIKNLRKRIIESYSSFNYLNEALQKEISVITMFINTELCKK